MLQRIDALNRDPNVHVRVTVPEDDATRSSMDDFPKHWEVAAARVIDTAETYEQAQAILGEYGRVFDPESSQVKFAPQGGLAVLYQTPEGLVPHPWETHGGRPRVAAASTVDELVKQLPVGFDLESRPTLLFMRGEKALHGWMEDGFAIVADEIVERFPSELMSHFKDRLQSAGVSTYKSGINRYGRTGEFYQKMGSLLTEYQERLGETIGIDDDYFELGNIRDRLLQRLEDSISQMENSKFAAPNYRERTEHYFRQIPEEFYPRLDFFTGPGKMRMTGLVRDINISGAQDWQEALSIDPEHPTINYLDIDEAIDFVENSLYFDVEATKPELARYRQAEERGFYYSPDRLTPEDPEYWQDWNVERVLGKDFDEAHEFWKQYPFSPNAAMFDRSDPSSVWNQLGKSQRRSMLFMTDMLERAGQERRGSLKSLSNLSVFNPIVGVDMGGMLLEKVLETAYVGITSTDY